MNKSSELKENPGNWQMATTVARLQEKKTLMVRVKGKQIAVFETSKGFRACDNRCPHEGYPLSEGSLSEDCTLTCNWHNWKFNIETGENLFGGDRLRTYPLEIRNDEIWIDIKELPYLDRYTSIVDNLRYAFDHNSYDQIARECARLVKLGADPMDPFRLAIEWSWRQMEFGWTHAYAGMADWLQLYDRYANDPEIQLTSVVESVSHASFDVLRQPEFPFAISEIRFDENGFVAAVEDEDQATAIAMIAGGLSSGLHFEDFESALSQAAIAHYNDFGHSLIYVTKAKALIARLGYSVERPLLLSLVRSLIYAAREDRIPEFRKYQTAVNQWGKGNNSEPAAANWYRKSINKSLTATVACSQSPPETIYKELLLANAVNMLGFDISQQSKVRVTVSGNVGWLDFTHGLTFANAVRKQCSRFPDLWPQGLLQMACFAGRNAAFTTESYDLDRWSPDDANTAFDEFFNSIFAHGQGEHIVSVHLLKTTLAVQEESERLSPDDGAVLLAALNRFLNSPLKRRLPLRVAHQSLQFVGQET